jgi:hypothetical protein
MAETAVGLFEDRGTADAVVDALRENGIPSAGIRIISQPTSLPVDSATSTPSLDSAAGVARDLSSMGMTEPECEAYLANLRKGNVLVFATGNPQQADTAVSIMNAHEPIELEEISGSAPKVPATSIGDTAPGTVNAKIESSRATSEGARVFSW